MRLRFQNMSFARHSPQLAIFHVTKKWHALNKTSITRKSVPGHKPNLTMNHAVLLDLHFCPSLWHCHAGVWWATAAGLSLSPSNFSSDWSFRCTWRPNMMHAQTLTANRHSPAIRTSTSISSPPLAWILSKASVPSAPNTTEQTFTKRATPANTHFEFCKSLFFPQV